MKNMTQTATDPRPRQKTWVSLTATLLIMLAAQFAHGQQSVRLALPAQLSKGTLPNFTARDRQGENLFQKRHLERIVSEAGAKRVALVYFATWCAPCAKGATVIRESREELKRYGVQAIFVNVGEKNVESIHKWIREYGEPTLPLVMDNRSNMASVFGLLEPNGTIVMPKVLVLNEKLTPLFLLGTEGDDFPEILWGLNP